MRTSTHTERRRSCSEWCWFPITVDQSHRSRWASARLPTQTMGTDPSNPGAFQSLTRTCPHRTPDTRCREGPHTRPPTWALNPARCFPTTDPFGSQLFHEALPRYRDRAYAFDILVRAGRFLFGKPFASDPEAAASYDWALMETPARSLRSSGLRIVQRQAQLLGPRPRSGEIAKRQSNAISPDVLGLGSCGTHRCRQ
jgi:hypothetical protein